MKVTKEEISVIITIECTIGEWRDITSYLDDRFGVGKYRYLHQKLIDSGRGIIEVSAMATL